MFKYGQFKHAQRENNPKSDKLWGDGGGGGGGGVILGVTLGGVVWNFIYSQLR